MWGFLDRITPRPSSSPPRRLPQTPEHTDSDANLCTDGHDGSIHGSPNWEAAQTSINGQEWPRGREGLGVLTWPHCAEWKEPNPENDTYRTAPRIGVPGTATPGGGKQTSGWGWAGGK